MALIALRRFVQRLASVAPRHLCQVANQIVVLALPFLEEDASGSSTDSSTSDHEHVRSTHPDLGNASAWRQWESGAHDRSLLLVIIY